jgi:uncharacterized protein YndB with AHSA1/START domain
MSGKTKVITKPGEQTIHITRIFDAPREKVFKALVDPELIPQWWGPAKYKTKIVKHDPRTGGEWRYVQTSDEGEFGFHGSFHEITAPSRAVQTFEFEGMPGHVALDALTLEEKDGQTVMTIVSNFQSVEDRDGMVASGMEDGLTEGHDRLEALLKKMD